MFTPYFDPDTEFDTNGNQNPWKNRALVKNAPQSAIEAFNEFKKLETKAELNGIYI
jgi:hypothetical protein